MAFPVVVFAGASSARGPSIPMGFLYSLVYLGILTAFAVGEKVSPPMGRQSTISLSFKDADIVRACGDGESILHSMQYSLIKRQRSLASEGTGDDMQKVSLLQKDIEAAFRSWRSGATFMRAGDLETALDTFVRLFRSGVTEPFVPCTIGLLAASMGDVTSGIEFILLALEALPKDIRLLSSAGNLYLTMGDVSSAYTFFSRAVDIADAAADSVAPAVSSLMDVHSKTRAWSTSDAHRGLALCALARKEQDHPLVHAAKHLRRAITAAAGDHQSMALLGSLLSRRHIVNTAANDAIVAHNVAKPSRPTSAMSASGYWLASALAVQPNNAKYHCAVAIDTLHVSPSSHLLCRLGFIHCRVVGDSVPAPTTSNVEIGRVAEGIFTSLQQLARNYSFSFGDGLFDPPVFLRTLDQDVLTLTTAINHLQQATWLDQEYSGAMLELSALLLLQSRFDEALTLLSRHRLLDPDSVWSPIFTALAHACLEEHADTIRYSHAALARIADQNMFARNLSLTDAGPTQFVDITTPFFGDHECGRHDQYPLPSMLEAELLCQFLIMRSSALTGHFTATAAAQKAIKETAPSIAFVADVAFAGYLFDGGLVEEAASAFQTLLTHNRTYLPARRGLGLALFRKGPDFVKDAISHLQQALDGDPEDSVASSYLSVLLFESGDWQRATQLARNAVTLDHTDPVYRYRLGRMYAAKGAWHDALREFSQTLALEPECGQCHVAAAEAFEAVGQLRSAEMSLQIASSLMPDCPLVRCRLGSVMLQTGNVNSAAASFTVGWDLAGPHSPSRQQCGGDASLHRSMLALDQPSPCLCMSTRETAVCWNNAGVASLTLGYVEDGVHFLNEALRLQPALQEALMNLEMSLEELVIDRLSIIQSSEEGTGTHSVMLSPPNIKTPPEGVKSTLDSWLVTVSDSLKLLRSASKVATTPGQSMSVNASANVTASTTGASVSSSLTESSALSTISASIRARPGSFELLDAASMYPISPRLWDSAVNVLPQQQPVPIDASTRSHRKPSPPPGKHFPSASASSPAHRKSSRSKALPPFSSSPDASPTPIAQRKRGSLLTDPVLTGVVDVDVRVEAKEPTFGSASTGDARFAGVSITVQDAVSAETSVVTEDAPPSTPADAHVKESTPSFESERLKSRQITLDAIRMEIDTLKTLLSDARQGLSDHRISTADAQDLRRDISMLQTQILAAVTRLQELSSEDQGP